MRYSSESEVTIRAVTVTVEIYLVMYKCSNCGVTREEYRRLDRVLAESDMRFMETQEKCFECQVSGHY